MDEVTKRTSNCSSCGRAIIWTLSPTGARLPLDARPVTAYFIVFDEGDTATHAESVKAVTDKALAALGPGEPSEMPPIYVSHFLTCPNAAQHRKAPASARASR